MATRRSEQYSRWAEQRREGGEGAVASEATGDCCLVKRPGGGRQAVVDKELAIVDDYKGAEVATPSKSSRSSLEDAR